MKASSLELPQDFPLTRQGRYSCTCLAAPKHREEPCSPGVANEMLTDDDGQRPVVAKRNLAAEAARIYDR